MRKIIILISLFITIHIGISAQENLLNSGFGIGYQLVQYQSDFGFGLNVISPYFANGRIGIRLKANIMFNQNVINNITEWVPYSNISLGTIGAGKNIGENIRLYGEGGVIGLFPSDRISSSNIVVGGYGLFGFEFFFSNVGNYFIEIGGVGTGAIADKIDTKPIYSNGMSISAGIRFFKK